MNGGPGGASSWRERYVTSGVVRRGRDQLVILMSMNENLGFKCLSSNVDEANKYFGTVRFAMIILTDVPIFDRVMSNWAKVC